MGLPRGDNAHRDVNAFTFQVQPNLVLVVQFQRNLQNLDCFP